MMHSTNESGLAAGEMGAGRSRMVNCPNSGLAVLAVIAILVGCNKTPAEHRDAGPSRQQASASVVVPASTGSASMLDTSPSQNLPVAAEVEAPPDRVSSGCGSFRFALTPGRIVRSANGPGTMDAVLSIYVRETTAIAQRISLKIDTDYQGTPDLDPEVVCGDFDFDGNDDFAVNDGHHASYGGRSYAVFLWRKRYKRFVLSRELSTLTEESLGFPLVDESAKRLVVFSKSGCCVHWTSEYAVISGIPRRMKTVREDERRSGVCVVTTETRQDGRWLKSESPCTGP